MAQAGFTGIEAAIQKLRKHKLLVPGKIAQAKRNLVYAVWVDLVKNTPQWSGNLVENWYIEVAGRKGSYQEVEEYVDPIGWDARTWLEDNGEPYKRGDNLEIHKADGKRLVDTIRWNSGVKIVNYAPYASFVDQNMGPPIPYKNKEDQWHLSKKFKKAFREVNIHPNYGRVAMVGYVTTKYKVLRNTKRFAK